MWMVLSIGAIVFALLNITGLPSKKNVKWIRFISMSLTALTLCAFYADGAHRVIVGDISGLMDIMPTMSKVLWVCTILSILLNSISLFKEKC